MTTTHASGFTAAEFAELRTITAQLHGEWFPAWEGVHPADLPAAARLAFDLERLVANVTGRHPDKLDCGETVQQKITRLNGRITG